MMPIPLVLIERSMHMLVFSAMSNSATDSPLLLHVADVSPSLTSTVHGAFGANPDISNHHAVSDDYLRITSKFGSGPVVQEV